MSITTNKDLRNLFIYQVYVRNHSESGDFKGLIKDLDRIKNMGVDIVYLLPIFDPSASYVSLQVGYTVADILSIASFGIMIYLIAQRKSDIGA